MTKFMGGASQPTFLTAQIESQYGAPISGQITVTTAGTEVYGPNVVGNGFYLKAHPSNTDTVWIGNQEGALPVGGGFPLDKGETIFVTVENLNLLYFDSDVSGEKVCWLRM